MQKLAILGGTFNPVHQGHLSAANTVLHQVNVDQILWVPTYCPAYKATKDLLHFAHRWEMVHCVTASSPRFSPIALITPHSFAIDTLTALQMQYPNSEWYWILGLDSFQSLPQWHRRHELVPQCTWLIAPRITASSQPVQESSQAIASISASITTTCEQVGQRLAAEAISLQWQLLDMPLVQVSSSLVRQYCRDGKPIDHLVPDCVGRYIGKHHLYKP